MSKQLTKAEEQIMQILWRIEKGFVNDILDKLPDPKPAYNTVSTIVRITSDCPLIDPEIVDSVINMFENNSYDYITNFLPTLPIFR